MVRDKDCELCKLVFDNEIVTSLIYRDKFITIVYCSTHSDTPLVVLNNHKSYVSYEQLRHIAETCVKLYPNRCFRRSGMNSNPLHWHEHLIPLKKVK